MIVIVLILLGIMDITHSSWVCGGLFDDFLQFFITALLKHWLDHICGEMIGWSKGITCDLIISVQLMTHCHIELGTKLCIAHHIGFIIIVIIINNDTIILIITTTTAPIILNEGGENGQICGDLRLLVAFGGGVLLGEDEGGLRGGGDPEDALWR